MGGLRNRTRPIDRRGDVRPDCLGLSGVPMSTEYGVPEDTARTSMSGASDMTLADERYPDMLQSPWALTSYAMVLVPTITFSILLPWSATFCMHNADSLLTAIISVTKITPYYWGQNRFGNLLPIMTSWITNIDANFMTQVTLRSLFATATPFICILIMKPRAPLAMTFGFTLALLLICLTHSTIHSFWIAGQPYGTSAALLAAAIAVTNLRGQAPLTTVIR